MYAQQDRGQLEVHEEDHNAEVDEGVRGGDQLRLLVEDEDDGGDDAGLGVTVKIRRRAGRVVVVRGILTSSAA